MGVGASEWVWEPPNRCGSRALAAMQRLIKGPIAPGRRSYKAFVAASKAGLPLHLSRLSHLPPPNHVSGFFGHHQGSRHGVGRGHLGHDRGVDHPQVL